MPKPGTTLLRAMITLMALALAAAPVRLALAQEQDAFKVRLEVGDLGVTCVEGCQAVTFGDDAWQYEVSLSQGRLVELTFVWAHVGWVTEKHVMVLEGYNLEWDQLDFENREATLRFIADQPGGFTFKCDLECELHDFIQRGHLKVSRGGGGAAAVTPTKLSLSPSFWVTGGDPVTLTAVLTDAKGLPVPKAEIRFFLAARLGPSEGPMEFGRARTDANGVAFLDFAPTLSEPKQLITARFDGMAVYDESAQSIELQEVGVPPPSYVTAPIGLEQVRGWAQVALAAVILTVWATFGFIMLQAARIAWVSRKG